MATSIMALEETQSNAALEESLDQTVPFEDLIRQRAHEIWVANGESGSAIRNWLEAEREILQS